MKGFLTALLVIGSKESHEAEMISCGLKLFSLVKK
jgi:hypothetical protein